MELAKECCGRIGAGGGGKSDCCGVSAVCVSGAVAKALSSSNVSVGAQDVYFENNGAFTGEISCAMLKDVGCSYVIIGHSERRHVIGEKDELINKKIAAAIHGGLLPIFCVGELLEERRGQ